MPVGPDGRSSLIGAAIGIRTVGYKSAEGTRIGLTHAYLKSAFISSRLYTSNPFAFGRDLNSTLSTRAREKV